MLLELSDAELETDLGFRPLQIKKVKRELEALTNKPAVAAAAPAPAPVAVHIAAAAPVATVPDTAAREAEEAKAKAEAKAEEEAKAKAAYQAKAAQDSQAAAAQAQRYAAAARLLGAADQHLQAAMKNLNEALKAQAVNTGIGIGERGRDHGFMHRRNEPAEMVTAAAAHKHCEGAKQLSEMASQEINQARAQCPELPPIRVPDVAVVGGIVMQGLFDSTMADAMRMSKIKGLQNAIQAGAKEVAIFGAASETFSQRNINCSVAESLKRFEEVVQLARDSGVAVRGYVSCVVGCPYEGPVSPRAAADVARALYGMGCYEVSMGDTIGVGTPASTARMFEEVMKHVPADKLAAHMHDTYGQALANILASLQMGVATVDASVAGLGGCPYAKGASGNVATEDVVYMLEGLGVQHGIDMVKLLHAGDIITRALGRPSGSRTALALKAQMQRERDELDKGKR